MTPPAIDLLPALYVVGVIALISFSAVVFFVITEDQGDDFGPY